MTTEAMIKELTSMQKDITELKRGLGIAFTRYNKLNYRVNHLKRMLGIELRKAEAAKQQQPISAGTKPSNQQTINFN